jgi:hypothetical protein
VQARGVKAEWERLFSRTNVERLSADTFDTLRHSTDAWLVMFSAAKCTACSDTKPNWYRLSQDAVGLARVALVDCDADPDLCRAEHVDPAQLPQFLAYSRGDKTKSSPTNLFNGEKVESHIAFPLIAKATIHGTVFLLMLPGAQNGPHRRAERDSRGTSAR